jgi:hypothetical protein
MNKLFPSLELGYSSQNEIQEEIGNYFKIPLRDLHDNDEVEGKPYLSEINEFSFIDEATGEETNKYNVVLYIVHDDDETYYEIPISLKRNDEIQKKVHRLSKLYALITGILEIEQPYSTQSTNMIQTVDLREFREFINETACMRIRVKTIVNDEITYNSFEVLKLTL